jgi:hypothetical protein
MAAIAQSDPYSIVSRKIGYSVGLEYLVRNVSRLVDAYVKDERLTPANWLTLVTSESGFGREPSAQEHFANFYFSLALIRKIGREIHSLHRLDSLSILRRSIGNDDDYAKALRFVMAHAVTESDGDIFLNALAGFFSRDKSKANIEHCLQCKWDAFTHVIVGEGPRRRLWDHLRVKTYQSDKKSKTAGGNIGVRTQSIDAALRRTSTTTDDFNLAVPDKYFDKALTPRRGWSLDLGLSQTRGELTPLGEAFLNVLNTLGLQVGPAYVFWPYPHELIPIKIDPAKLSNAIRSPWEILSAISTAWGSSEEPKAWSDNELSKFVKDVYDKYRSGDVSKRLLRQQLPLFVLYPVYVAYCVANQRGHVHLPTFIDMKSKESSRKFNLVAIRGTEGAIEVRQ